MHDYEVELIDARSSLAVKATILANLSPLQVCKVEAVWGPARLEAVEKLILAGRAWDDLPEHLHWNWSNKLRGCNPDRSRFVAVQCGGEVQGLMRLDWPTESARISPVVGQPLMYVNFLESAPWNARQLTAMPRFKLSGFRLIEAAVRFSQRLGYDGRVGLHALPQANGFYEGSCGMKSFGPDPVHDGLTYYELPSELASYYLRGEPWTS